MKYRKKPVVVEAVQWTGDNWREIFDFCYDGKTHFCGKPSPFGLEIHTLEGYHHAIIGDYIIKGVRGEFYPCKPDIFHLTYEEVSQ